MQELLERGKTARAALEMTTHVIYVRSRRTHEERHALHAMLTHAPYMGILKLKWGRVSGRF